MIGWHWPALHSSFVRQSCDALLAHVLAQLAPAVDAQQMLPFEQSAASSHAMGRPNCTQPGNDGKHAGVSPPMQHKLVGVPAMVQSLPAHAMTPGVGFPVEAPAPPAPVLPPVAVPPAPVLPPVLGVPPLPVAPPAPPPSALESTEASGRTPFEPPAPIEPSSFGDRPPDDRDASPPDLPPVFLPPEADEPPELPPLPPVDEVEPPAPGAASAPALPRCSPPPNSVESVPPQATKAIDAVRAPNREATGNKAITF